MEVSVLFVYLLAALLTHSFICFLMDYLLILSIFKKNSKYPAFWQCVRQTLGGAPEGTRGGGGRSKAAELSECSETTEHPG